MSAARVGRVVLAVVVLTWSGTPGASAPAGRYTISTATVKDEVTGLVWQRAARATASGWADASAYCQSLSLSGYPTGWRLPEVKELVSILDHGEFGPPIDPTAFPSTPLGYYWTSTFDVTDSTYAWTVQFITGSTSRGFDLTAPGQTRCVH